MIENEQIRNNQNMSSLYSEDLNNAPKSWAKVWYEDVCIIQVPRISWIILKLFLTKIAQNDCW